MPPPTKQQQTAIEAEGNVLLMAGAGAGKTTTLVNRILDRVLSETHRFSLEDLLVVTFTEAAASEMRHRLRIALEERVTAAPDDEWIAGQLANLENAQVSTLHAYCLRLIREHFHELDIDPQFTLQDETQTAVLKREVLDATLDRYYSSEAPQDDLIRSFLERYSRDSDYGLKILIEQVHDYARTLPEAGEWLATQRRLFLSPEPSHWRSMIQSGLALWTAVWLDHAQRLAEQDSANFAAAESLAALRELQEIARTIPKTAEPRSWTQTELALALGEPDAASRPSRGPGRRRSRRQSTHSEDPPGNEISASEPRIVSCLERIISAGDKRRFVRGQIGKWHKPLESLFAEAAQLHSFFVAEPGGPDPLMEDWSWARRDVLALLHLVTEFTHAFEIARRAASVVDFADLEQLALRLLWDPSAQTPTPLARQWQNRIELLFVDEYQDINGAQDRIITCLSRSGAEANRFFVGDVKQSVYRFRRADPRIFQRYAADWRDSNSGRVLPLVENFRSHQRILEFVNRVFSALFRADVGGVSYGSDAHLVFGAPDERPGLLADPDHRVEFFLLLDERRGSSLPPEDNPANDPTVEDLDLEEAQARWVAQRLRELHDSGTEVWDSTLRALRPVRWRDMVILHPAPRPVAERWARQFLRAGVPFDARRGGFFDALEVADLVNLTRLLDNPRQDLPLLAVLRSPLVAMSVDECVALRVARRDGSLWDALGELRRGIRTPPGEESGALLDVFRSAQEKAALFLDRYERWRRVAREGSLGLCLELVLADTGYEAMLRAQSRSEARMANLHKLLALTREFDQFQRHGLFRFLLFLDAQSQAGRESENAPAAVTDSVRLLSIHQSKGLEFPITVVAGLGRGVNLLDLRGDWLIDDDLGICPPVLPPDRRRGYHSVARWFAEFRQRGDLMGEQIRLLYVAMTRAADRLILVGTARPRSAAEWIDSSPRLILRDVLRARTPMDWLGPLLPMLTGRPDWSVYQTGTGTLLDWSIHRGPPEFDPTPVASIPEQPLDAGTIDAIRSRLGPGYRWLTSTREPGKTAVTRLTRNWLADEEAAVAPEALPESRRSFGPPGEAVERGVVHHLFCELVELEKTTSRNELMSEAQRLQLEGWLTATQAALLDLDGLWGFWGSEFAGQIRAHARFVHREFPFTARLRPTDVERFQGTSAVSGFAADDFQIIQGIVDLVVLAPDQIWIVDFKTDRVSAGEAGARGMEYRYQLGLYAHALGSIYGRPVSRCCLYFIAARRLISIDEQGEEVRL